MQKNSFRQLPCNKYRSAEGFSLIEALIAMFILTVGILSLYSMQINSVRGNSRANLITESSTWASDQVEYLLALDYDHADLTDGEHGPVTHDRYSIKWEVKKDDPHVDNKTIVITVSTSAYGGDYSSSITSIKGKIN